MIATDTQPYFYYLTRLKPLLIGAEGAEEAPRHARGSVLLERKSTN
jgi:hypothetical protein